MALSMFSGGQSIAKADPPVQAPPVPSDFFPSDDQPISDADWYRSVIAYLKALYAYLGGNPDDLIIDPSTFGGHP